MTEDFTRGWPRFADDEIEAVERVLRSGRVNQWTGSEVHNFESAFSDYVGSDHAAAVANGTVALELALRALELGPGDDIIVTSRSFVASAGVAALVGATPVFADVDRDSQNITIDTVEDALTPSTRAIVAVHLNGWPCEMNELAELASDRDLWLIEDCAQALGAAYRGRPVGSSGHVAAWSFCQDKIMTTGGEGGMVTTSDATIFEKVWSFKDHGKSLGKMRGAMPGRSFKWVHDTVGSNLRMTEMQAAIGNTALPKVDGWVKRRRELAARLDRIFADSPALRTVTPPPHVMHAYYKYYTFVDTTRSTEELRNVLLARLEELDLPGFVGICGEVYREAAFEDAGFAPESPLPNARELAQTALMIPLHPYLSDDIVEAAGRGIAQALVGLRA